jgi:hypothetical protein
MPGKKNYMPITGSVVKVNKEVGGWTILTLCGPESY